MEQDIPRSGRRTLIRISAALASRASPELSFALEEGLRVGNAVEVEEVILQSYLFLGYPVALNAFALWRELSGREAGTGALDDWMAWAERGEEVCERVYGGQYLGLRENVKALHPDMERWMVVEGYGKVLGRPGLDLATRELCIVSLLAVLRAPRQLYSHLRGALNAGASQEEVQEALETACSLLDEKQSAESRGIWEKVKDRAIGPHNAYSQGTS